jgi:outer membrane murein-binding lipoprotein Lpp
MPETAATLKDVTSSNQSPTTATEPTKAADTTATSTTINVADTDAAELGKTLLEMGVTKDQINSILEAPQALQSIRYMVENDPQEFIRSLERTNPGAGENFLDKLSKLYVDRYARDDKAGDGKGKTDADELQSQIRDLSEKVNGFNTRAEQAAAASAQAQVMARFNARVDDLFGQLPADKVPLTAYEKRIITGAMKDELTSDSNAVKRIYNGNFVDVPRTFKTIVEGLVNDRKAAADASKAARERTNSSAFPDFGAGPVELPKDFYDVTNVPLDKLWDEDNFVNAITKT